MQKEVIVILHNIRSAYNVGSVFRTADAVSVLKIFLTGYTPAPIDRFSRLEKKISKTALGAEKSVAWEKISLSSAVLSLKKKGFKIFAVEQDNRAKNFRIKKPTKSAFIFGNETKGLPKSVLTLADEILEIPMKGKKESLNVSVSAGIVLFS